MSEDAERAAMRAMQDWDAGDRNAATPEDVYRVAAAAMFDRDEVNGDDERLFEWHNCPSCPNGQVCSCAGVPYPSEPVRAAVDAARAPLLARIAELEAERDGVDPDHPCLPCVVIGEGFGGGLEVRCGNCGTAERIGSGGEMDVAEFHAWLEAHCQPNDEQADRGPR